MLTGQRNGQRNGHPVRTRLLTLTGQRAYGWLVAAVTLAALLNLAFSGQGFVFWPDSIGYLGPVADLQAGRGFTAWLGRGFLYPAFLAMLMPDSGQYLRVLYAQMALLAGVFAFAGWLAWLCGQSLSPLPPWRAVTARAVLLTGLISFDFNYAQLGLAHTAMPETAFTALLALQCFLVCTALLPGHARTQWISLTGLTALGLLLILLKPHYLVTAFALPGVIALMLRNQLPLRFLLLALVLGGVAAAPFHLVDRHLKAQYDPVTARLFAPRTLFCNNLDVLTVAFQRGMADDLAVGPQAAEILSQGSGGWDTLGFNGDTCSYGDLARTINSHFTDAPEAEARYYYTTYLTAALTAPDQVLRRLSRQIRKVIAAPLPGRLELSGDCRVLAEASHRGALFGALLSECRATAANRISYHDIKPKVFNAAYITVMVLCGLCLIVRWRCRAAKTEEPTAVWGKAGAASLLAVLSYILLVGLVHSFDVFRYLAIIAPLFLLSFCAMTVWLFSAAPGLRKD